MKIRKLRVTYELQLHSESQDNMSYFQDNQLDTFSTMDYCSCLKIHMALFELIHVFSYLNLNQEMPDNKCLFSEKKCTTKHFNRIFI